MEFDEVNHFVKHGKPTTPLDSDDRSIAALAIGTPYYPDFPYPQTFTSINNKKRPITAKFVDTVRHRLKKSSSVTASTNSNVEGTDLFQHHSGSSSSIARQQQSQRRRPLKRATTSTSKKAATTTTTTTTTTTRTDRSTASDSTGTRTIATTTATTPLLVKSSTDSHHQNHRPRERSGGHRLLLSRLKKQQQHHHHHHHHTSGGVVEEGGYYSVDDSLYRRTKQRSTSSRLWKRRRRPRRLSSAIEPPDPMSATATTTTTTTIPVVAALSTQKLADLQMISDQMRRFCVPSDWASVTRRPSLTAFPLPPILEGLDRQRGSPLTLASVLNDMTMSISRYQYLCDQEQQRIESSRQEIEEHVFKLQQLDRDVEQLNSKIVLARSEGMEGLQHMLQDTQLRLPLVKEARLRHKRTVAAIEGYNKSMNYAVRLADLQSKVFAARQRQLTWNCVQQWIPSIVLLAASALLGLLISYTH
ncbi:hypothetical protein BDB00DRAFT_841962 [Zychaea mexicana]|uniref:uncharacterized protein n=1 Tax=Zychaea mexicana TaxID=64656 RepID=UPI0022FE9560|nr:uncharacterized protein BDB00DRAFT_841962 [Zychaea mexicana]KAI9489676.1 hypothetical protein BDB00DRAFT_841962 [Zychaea mexicana]